MTEGKETTESIENISSINIESNNIQDIQDSVSESILEKIYDLSVSLFFDIYTFSGIF